VTVSVVDPNFFLGSEFDFSDSVRSYIKFFF
jgi:hypothetical protein